MLLNFDDVVESKVIVFVEEYLRLMLLVQQEQANEHVEYFHHMWLMHNVAVFRSSMLENYHRSGDGDDVVGVVIDYRDYVPMVKHRI